MKVLIIGDTHIEEKNISELTDIIKEINQYDADQIIQLGDFFNNHRPTPIELEFGTKIVKDWKKKYKKVTIMAGNGKHDILNGESVVKYLQHLGVKVVGMEHDLTIDKQKIKLAHIMLRESRLEYGTGKYGLKDLKDYDYVFLGHQHSPESFNKRIHHLGSIFYQNWNEVQDKNKQIAILEDGKLSFIPLKSPIPMVDISLEGNPLPCTLEKILCRLDSKTKVRVIFTTFTQYKENLPIIKKYKHKFYQFKIKLDYVKANNFKVAMNETFKESKSMDKILIEAIKQIKDKDVRELIEGVL